MNERVEGLSMTCHVFAEGFETMDEVAHALRRKGPHVDIDFILPISGENPKLLIRRIR